MNYKGTAGSVVTCSEIRLVDWIEGGFRTTDTPNSRGEIYIGGNNVTLGYYNMPDKTAEDYRLIDGVRYFATGDIGEMVNGNLKIIDRKKDLVKLQGGEYVSLNKVETILKLLPFVDNCCVVADPTKSSTVCLIVPNRVKLSELVFDQTGNKITDSELSLTYSSNQILTRIVQQFCEYKNIARFEIPKRVRFVPELWLPDSGMVTDSLKIKRKQIENFYFQVISQLYE